MTTETSAGRDFVVRTARENDVKFIRLWFADILGKLKGFAVSVDDLEDALERGVGFDGSAIDGFARHHESDMRAYPDPETFNILPWRPRQNAVARMFCDIRHPRGQAFPGDPRQVLRRNLDKAAEMGFTYNVGAELEFFYLKNSTSPELLDHDGYFDQLSSFPASDLRRDTVLNLAEMGIPVRYSHHEGAPSQHEIDLEYTDALTMADNLMTAKLVIKELAQLQNVYATFMPKPMSRINGSGLHLHQSLFNGDDNRFYDADDEQYLSMVGKQFIAGLIRHAAEITLVTNQWVNSYKRLVPGYEAPVYVSWTHVNRSDLIRVPSYERGEESSIRIEYRSPDPSCNPYLAFSAMLAAGLKGIEEQYEVPAPVVGNVQEMSLQRRQSLGIRTLPSSLGEAIALSETSELLYESLGDHVFHSLIENKKMEWDEYRSEVTDYEVSRYLSTL